MTPDPDIRTSKYLSSTGETALLKFSAHLTTSLVVTDATEYYKLLPMTKKYYQVKLGLDGLSSAGESFSFSLLPTSHFALKIDTRTLETNAG